MPANQYEIDNPVKVSALFKKLGTPTDPSTITLQVKKPDGTKTTYTYPADITKTATGAFEKEVPSTNIPGNWYYKWKGTGAVVAASETYFTVLPSEF